MGLHERKCNHAIKTVDTCMIYILVCERRIGAVCLRCMMCVYLFVCTSVLDYKYILCCIHGIKSDVALVHHFEITQKW